MAGGGNMAYEFYKLADVDINNEVTEDTYSLVVNGEEVQKTKNTLIGTGSYKDFTSDYESSSYSNMLDFVKSLSVEIDSPKPYDGYVLGTNEYCIFEVSGTFSETKIRVQHYYLSGNEKHFEVYDYYNGSEINEENYKIIGNTITKFINSSETIFNDQDVTIDGSLSVKDNADIGGNIVVDGNSSVGGTLSINGSLPSGKTMFVGGDTVISGDTSITGDTSINGGVSIGDTLNVNGSLPTGKTAYIGGDTQINGSITSSGGVTVGGSASIAGNITVSGTGTSSIAGNLEVGTAGQDKYIRAMKGSLGNERTYVHGNSINLYKDFSSANSVDISSDSQNNLEISSGGNDTKIVGVSDPTNDNEAANKKYVDDITSSFGNVINGLLSTLGGGSGDPYSIQFMDYPYLNTNTTGQGIIRHTFEVADPTAVGSQSSRLKILGIWHNLDTIFESFVDIGTEKGTYKQLDFNKVSYSYVTTPSNRIDVSMIYNYGGSNVQGTNILTGCFRLIYAVPLSFPDSSEVIALRVPYDYTGTITSYVEGTVYHADDYCYYPDISTGVLYRCVVTNSQTQWDSDDWVQVSARESIDSAFDIRLRKDGTDVWSSGNLNMGSSSGNPHKIINLADPTNAADAATKTYVDTQVGIISARNLTLDANGILSFG